MLDAIVAETLKLRRHRATWLMVWIFPVVVALVTAAVLVYHSVAGAGAPSPDKGAATWIANSTLLLRFPSSSAGRSLTAGFAALVFAGEYSWNTWKLIVPARDRWQLVVAKWVVTFGLVAAAMIAADLIGLAATAIDAVRGDPVPAGVTVPAIAAAHLRAGAFALVPIASTIAFAALFAIVTRSLLAAVILSFALLIIEGLLPIAAIYLYPRAPALVEVLVKALPFYHLANIGGWAKGTGVTLLLRPGTTVAMSLAASLAVIAAWIAAAAAATLTRFIRQDLN